MESAQLVINKIIEVSNGKIYKNLGEDEILNKMTNQYFFGVVEYHSPADDVPSDDRIMIHYYLSFEEYEREIAFFEKKLYHSMKVVNRFSFEKSSFFGGYKKPIGYQVDPTSILQP